MVFHPGAPVKHVSTRLRALVDLKRSWRLVATNLPTILSRTDFVALSYNEKHDFNKKQLPTSSVLGKKSPQEDFWP